MTGPSFLARVALTLALIGAVGCAASGDDAPPPPPLPDTGAPDTTRADTGDTGDLDTGDPDTGRDDAGDAGPDADGGDADASDVDPDASDVEPDAGDASDASDASVVAITIDGTLSEGEWDDVPVVRNTEETVWVGNELRSLRAIADDTTLYVAIEGIVEPLTNTIVLYVDGQRGEVRGVQDLFSLTDGIGPIDDSVSAGITIPSDVYVDLAFGVRTMPDVAMGFDPDIGWRDISMVTDFGWIEATEAPAICLEEVCETSIPLSALGTEPGDTIAMFARLINDTGTAMMNRQTLPEDDPGVPNDVTMLLELEAP